MNTFSIDDTPISLGRILWDYLRLGQQLRKADCILVLGGHDPNVAYHAADLFAEKWAPFVIVSGGSLHPPLHDNATVAATEADALGALLLERDVPSEAIILETRARNTSENFWLTEELIRRLGLKFSSFILVSKPYQERRTYATGLKRWPDRVLVVSSQRVTYDEYLQNGIPPTRILSMMVGEVQRIRQYADEGYLVAQHIPDLVWQAQSRLVEIGYIARSIV